MLINYWYIDFILLFFLFVLGEVWCLFKGNGVNGSSSV